MICKSLDMDHSTVHKEIMGFAKIDTFHYKKVVFGVQSFY